MNVLTENLPMLLEGTGETLAMVFVSALFAYVIGLPLGVALIVTDKNGLHPMRGVSAVLGWIGIPLMNANLDALLRTSLPLEMQGRVYAARNALQFFTIPLGYLLGGALVDALSASEALGAVPLLSARLPFSALWSIRLFHIPVSGSRKRRSARDSFSKSAESARRSSPERHSSASACAIRV